MVKTNMEEDFPCRYFGNNFYGWGSWRARSCSQSVVQLENDCTRECELNGINLFSERSSRKYERPMLCKYVAILCREYFAKASYSGTY